MNGINFLTLFLFLTVVLSLGSFFVGVLTQLRQLGYMNRLEEEILTAAP